MKPSGKSFTRRDLLSSMGVGALYLALPDSIRAQAGAIITVADPGGPYGPAFRKAFYDPFEKATGIRVVNVPREAEPVAQFKAIVETKSYIWDVCTLTLSARDILTKQGLLEPIGFARDVAPSLMPAAISPFWLGTDVYSTVMAFRKDRYQNGGPRGWSDFWDVQRFPGRRCMRKNPIDTLEQALFADGVELEKLYPLDIERAFRSLDRIKPHVSVWWTGGAQSTQLLQSGEVDMIAGWNSRFQAAIDGGAPAEIAWDQGLYSVEGWAIPKGSPKTDDARQFIRFCASAERQAVFTDVLAYGPTNLDAYKTISADRAKVLPTSPYNLKKMTVANEDWWSANRASVTERFNNWLLS